MVKEFYLWIHLLEGILKPLAIYYNNTIPIIFSHNNKNFAYIKHFDVKYQFVKEKICENLAYFKYVLIDHMLMDPLTKGSAIEMFRKHVIGIESFDILGQ